MAAFPDYTLLDSARLHNKLKIEGEKVIFPDQELSYNIKVLLWFHTEFILDNKGFFLNEIDGEVVTEKGIVNGASFNYGTDGPRHWDLDVDPIRHHDPNFRREVAKGFQSPSRVFANGLSKIEMILPFLTLMLRGFIVQTIRVAFLWSNKRPKSLNDLSSMESPRNNGDKKEEFLT